MTRTKRRSSDREISSKHSLRREIPRIALAAIFLFSGIDGFLGLVPAPNFSPEGQSFITALKESGFAWTLLKLVEVAAGILLLFGSMGQLGVLLLIPICVSMMLFHFVLSLEGSALAWIAVALEGVMIYLFWDNLKAMFTTRHQAPTLATDEERISDRIAPTQGPSRIIENPQNVSAPKPGEDRQPPTPSPSH